MRRFFRITLSCLSLALPLGGCHSGAPQNPAPPPAPQVTVAHPLVKTVIDHDQFTARLAAVDSVEIRARVSGYLEKVNFKDGQIVKAGDLLYVIDPRPYQAELDRSQADLVRSQTLLALAQSEFNRAKGLLQGKAISTEEFDTRQQSQAGATAAIQSAQASVDTAKLNLEFCSIMAPISGRVSRTMVTEGNLVDGGAGVTTTLLTTLVSIDPIYAYADVDEGTVLRYQSLGLGRSDTPIACDLALGDSHDFRHHGHVDFVDNAYDANTGTLRIRAVFANGEGLLVPNQYGLVRVAGSEPYQGLLIPDFAVGSDQEKKIVDVVGPDKKIAVKQITLGPVIDGLRVIRSGLSADDWVVLDRLQIIQPGMPVTTTEQAIKPNDSNLEVATEPAKPSS